jgi:hypothetical protein
VNVVKSLSNMLDEAGLGTLPVGEPLPLDQNGMARVYRTRSNIGAIVDAVVRPSGKGDETLRSLGAGDAEDVLARVREIVCG